MITEDIRLLPCGLFQLHTRMGWEIASAKRVLYSLKSRGFKLREAQAIMRETSPVEEKLVPIITRLTHRNKIIGFRVQTWFGQRFGSERDVGLWLSGVNGYEKKEIATLFRLSPSVPISASEAVTVKADVRYGIRA